MRFNIRILLLSLLVWALSSAVCYGAIEEGRRGPLDFFRISLIRSRELRLDPLVCWKAGTFLSQHPGRFHMGSMLHVKLLVKSGTWISVVCRDSAGTLFDLDVENRRLNAGINERVVRLPSRFLPGDVEVFLYMWKDYNPDTGFMVGPMQRSGWIRLGQLEI